MPYRCPIDQVTESYQNLVNPDDIFIALAIEKQVLAICRQRQEALIQIAENEMCLTELFEPIIESPSILAPVETRDVIVDETGEAILNKSRTALEPGNSWLDLIRENNDIARAGNTESAKQGRTIRIQKSSKSPRSASVMSSHSMNSGKTWASIES